MKVLRTPFVTVVTLKESDVVTNTLRRRVVVKIN